jgi:hypothetical protein
VGGKQTAAEFAARAPASCMHLQGCSCCGGRAPL